MDKQLTEKLIEELIGINNMMLVIDSGGAVSEMSVKGAKAPEFTDGWALVETEGWHVHLNMKSVAGVQFVEAEDRFHDFPKLYYVRISDSDEKSLLRFYFPNPWLDEQEKRTEFQPDKLKLFEEFRDRYVGRGGIAFVQRPASGEIPE